MLVLIVLPLSGILAFGAAEGFSRGEWGLVVLGTVVLVGLDWWQTRPFHTKAAQDVASLSNDSR